MVRMLAFSLIVAIVVLPLVATHVQAEGLLSSAASESRTDDPDPPKSEEPKRRDRHHQHHCDDDGIGAAAGELAGTLLLYGTLAAVDAMIPDKRTIVCVNESGQEVTYTIYGPPGYFSDYPYQHEFGYMLMGDAWVTTGKTTSIRGSVEYGSDFGDLSRVGTKLLVEGTSRWGIDIQWDEYFENLPSGGTDQLTLGDLNFTFRVPQGYHSQFRFGLGTNLLEDRNGSEFGINFTTGYDVYLGKPWIWSTEMDLGKVGSADLFRIRSTLGAQWKRVEVFAGYQYTNLEGIELDGFVSGMRFWF
ncbi:hypothetical protein Pan97_36680 [Bremerella volcania]|uniref:Uncharacterized protein n=1 Tax=Bremerella volcania TaxID=2527984 RepID=A0A518CBL1_9BACT|nr:hypothetical protein [Bremerella volcania]QDU76616.1 hypothetical protein Pan97_36680 [Bremerella volcania]